MHISATAFHTCRTRPLLRSRVNLHQRGQERMHRSTVQPERSRDRGSRERLITCICRGLPRIPAVSSCATPSPSATFRIFALRTMGQSMELHPSNDNGYTDSKSPHNTEIEVLSEADRDVQALARLGKKPILKVSMRTPIDPSRGSLTTPSGALPSCPYLASPAPS